MSPPVKPKQKERPKQKQKEERPKQKQSVPDKERPKQKQSDPNKERLSFITMRTQRRLAGRGSGDGTVKSEGGKELFRRSHKIKAILGDVNPGSSKADTLKRKSTIKEVNEFLVLEDIGNLPEEKKEEMSSTIWGKGLGFISSLDWLSVANLINNHQTKSTADILLSYTSSKRCAVALSEFYKLDWSDVRAAAAICVTEHWRSHLDAGPIALSWCLAHRGTTDDVTIEQVCSGVCYKAYGDVYNSHILLPTVRHLLPGTTELKCSHAGGCYSALLWERAVVNKNLYKLIPFTDEVATLSIYNGNFKLVFNNSCWGILFKKSAPYEPFCPLHCKAVDDAPLRRLIASLKPNDEIVILKY